MPGGNLIGEEGRGSRLCLDLLTRLRFDSAENLGIAVAAQRMAIARAKRRETFGVPLSDRQAIQWIRRHRDRDSRCALARLGGRVEGGSGEDFRVEASVAKLYSSEVLGRVVDAAVQIHGGTASLSSFLWSVGTASRSSGGSAKGRRRFTGWSSLPPSCGEGASDSNPSLGSTSLTRTVRCSLPILRRVSLRHSAGSSPIPALRNAMLSAARPPLHWFHPVSSGNHGAVVAAELPMSGDTIRRLWVGSRIPGGVAVRPIPGSGSVSKHTAQFAIGLAVCRRHSQLLSATREDQMDRFKRWWAGQTFRG